LFDEQSDHESAEQISNPEHWPLPQVMIWPSSQLEQTISGWPSASQRQHWPQFLPLDKQSDQASLTQTRADAHSPWPQV